MGSVGRRTSRALLLVKKCFCAVCALAIALLCVMPASVAHAENSYFDQSAYASNIWSKHADTSWYTSNKGANSYTITTASQLAGLAVLVTQRHVTFENKTVYLGANIDLKGHQWFPIGCNEDNYWQNSPFKGTFDGRGHKITNLYIRNAWHHQALFGNVVDATIKNFSVSGSVTTGWGAAGVVAEMERTTLSNITNYCDVETLFKSGDGGYSSTAGGVVAYVVDVYVANNGAKASQLLNLKNYGNVEIAGITEQGGGVGGIVGSLLCEDEQTITISQCENYGTVHASSSNYADIYAKGAGGIIGSTATYGNYNVTDCANHGSVSSDNLASTGGIVGALSGLNSSVSYCYNSGSVNGASPEAESSVGGIVGRSVASHSGSTLLTIMSCYNTGSVTGRGSHVSGILGVSSGYGEDYDDTDAGTTVINDSNYYVEDSVTRPSQGNVLFQQGTVDAAQPVSAERMNSQEVIDNLNATDDSMDHYAEGENSPKLELRAGGDKGFDDSSTEGEGDSDTNLAEDGDDAQKETHMYAVQSDNVLDNGIQINANYIIIIMLLIFVLVIVGSVLWQLKYNKSQRRPLKAVPSVKEEEN